MHRWKKCHSESVRVDCTTGLWIYVIGMVLLIAQSPLYNIIKTRCATNFVENLTPVPNRSRFFNGNSSGWYAIQRFDSEMIFLAFCRLRESFNRPFQRHNGAVSEKVGCFLKSDGLHELTSLDFHPAANEKRFAFGQLFVMWGTV